MRSRLVVLALISAMLGGGGSAWATEPVQAHSPGGLAIPNVPGTLGRGGQILGTIALTRLTYRPGGLTADGTIFLDQLGQQVDPGPAVLDLATLPRQSQVQAMLLFAVASQLESVPSGGQPGAVNELLPVVNRALGGAR